MDDQLTDLIDADRSLFPGSFTILAIRDSRYHNSAYAIAELLDNSIEAGAPLIELLCMEDSLRVELRSRRRVSEIAVLDNGEGMNAKTLLEALKFDGGTRHDSTTGIGKYGMGLPTSSMSQCKRVDVWTWQDGWQSALHSSIDADEIEGGTTKYLFLTETRQFLIHGEAPEATKFMAAVQAPLLYGENWTRFSGRPPRR